MAIYINFENKDYKRLRDIFDIARCNKSKEYPKDTILVQVSVTRGQVIYLDKAQHVADGSKYAALTVKEPDKYNAKYLYYMLDENMPDIVRRCKSGINLQMDALSGEKILVHLDIDTQNTIVDLIDIVQEWLYLERKTVELLKQHRLEMMRHMFPEEGITVPRWRFYSDK